jgi:hypothetical protein
MTTTNAPSLHRLDEFPDALLDIPGCELWRHLPGPTLFHIQGRHEQPVLATVLLHGNEETGWRAVQAVLKEHRRRLLPRSLLLFVGNIEAAKAGVRTLSSQNDYNRAWPGTLYTELPEARLMREVTDIAARHRPFASIDIHNNSGFNPHYACVNRLEDPHLHLASLFSRTVVYFVRPLGVQSAALASICPSVTVECGRIGTEDGIAHAAEFLSAALALSHFPEHPVPDGDIDIMQTFAIVRVPRGASVSFNGSDADFRFREDLDSLNFAELAPGTSIGRLGDAATRKLEIVSGGALDLGVETGEPLFAYDDGEITLRRCVIPSMLTTDTNAIELDCLGYLMHRIGRDGARLRG